MTKICGICQKSLPLSKFPMMNDNRKPKPYPYYRCYTCHRLKNHEYFLANKEKMYAQNQVYWAKHKKKRAIYNRKYRRLFVSPNLKASDMQPLGRIS